MGKKGYFLTQKAAIRQLNKKGMYKVLENELYVDEDGTPYFCWRLFQTDNFTWINSSDWDIRCSHIHDIGCKYHQVVKVKLTVAELFDKGYLIPCENGCCLCNDIPVEYLEVVKVSGHQINNMFYRMLKATDAPKYVQFAYRAGVSLNFGWFWSGKQKIDLNKLYCEEWNSK
jgi:hypothetical protein